MSGNDYKKTKGKYDVNSIIKRLNDRKKGLENISHEIHRLQDDGSLISLAKKGGRGFKGILVSIGGMIPFGVGEKIKHDYDTKTDPLNTFEKEYRAHLDGVEGTIIDLKEVTKQADQQIEGLEGTLKKINEENWGINQIRRYIMEDSENAVNEEALDFFEYLTDETLTDEEREKKRKNLVEMLNNKLEVLKAEQPYLGEIAKMGGEIYDSALMQYNGFMSLKSSLEKMRDSALGYANTNHLTLFTKDYVSKLIEETTKTLETGIDALEVAQDHLIASKETVDEIKAARERVKQRLEAAMSPVKTAKVKVNKAKPKIKT